MPPPPCPAQCGCVRTGVVGSFPKPASLVGKNGESLDWFQHGDLGSTFTPPEQDVAAMFSEEQWDEAVSSVLKRQAGLDVVSDGELRRDNYVNGFMRKLHGVDFALDRRTVKACRQGAYVCELPTIVAALRARDGVRRLAETEWGPAQRRSDLAGGAPVKFTLPGPLTCSDTIADKHYVPTYGEEEGRKRLMADLAPLLRAEVDALVSAGCQHIQIDEPLLARYPQYARAVLPLVDDILAGAARAGRHTYVHMCCGYPDKLDNTEYLKADRQSYVRLAPLIEELCPHVTAVSIEDAHRRNDLAALLPLFKTKTVMLGVVAIARSRVETSEEIEARAREALQFLPPGRLILAPDCGLAMLPDHVIDAKLRSLTSAAERLRVGGGSPARSAAVQNP